MKPSFSVAVLTYNRANYLKEMLESIQNQSYSDFEVTIYDNASEDNTEEVVKTFLKDPRFKYTRNEKNIEIGNYIRAVKECETDFRLITHDDDIMEKDFIKRTIETLEQYPDAIHISTAARVIDSDGNITSKDDAEQGSSEPKEKLKIYNQFEYIDQHIDQKASICCPTSTFNIKKMKENSIIVRDNIGLSADTFWFYELNTLKGQMIFINEKLYRYRVHSNQESRKWLYMIPLLRNPVNELLRDKNPSLCKKCLKYITPHTTNAIKIATYTKEEYDWLKKCFVLSNKIDFKMRFTLYFWIFHKNMAMKCNVLYHKLFKKG